MQSWKSENEAGRDHRFHACHVDRGDEPTKDTAYPFALAFTDFALFVVSAKTGVYSVDIIFIASVSPLLSRVCSGKKVRSNPADAGRNRSILIYCSTTALRSQEKPQANHGFAAKKRLLCCGASEIVSRSRARQEKCFATAGASGFPFARKVTEGVHPFGISSDRLQVCANSLGAANASRQMKRGRVCKFSVRGWT